MEKYRESTLDLLFEKTKTTMPRGAPASLSDKAYVDIVSYLLKVNEFPAGAEELRVEDLREHPGDRKRRTRAGAGFFARARRRMSRHEPSDGAWMLLHSTDPVRTGNPQPAAGEPEMAQSWQLGPKTYRLLVSAAYKPDGSQAAQGRSQRISDPPADREPPEHHVARHPRPFLRRVVKLGMSIVSSCLRVFVSIAFLFAIALVASAAAQQTAPLSVRRGSRRRERDRIPGRRHPRLRHRQRTQVRQTHSDVAGAARRAARARARHCSERERPAPVRQHRQAACRLRSGHRENRLGEDLRRQLLRSPRAVS